MINIISFVFKPYDQITPDENFVVIEGALDKFAEILNNAAVYQSLSEELAEGMALSSSPSNIFDLATQLIVRLLLKGAEDYDYPTIGNVGDSLLADDSADSTFVSDIFTDSVTDKDYLTLVINGETIKVKAIIQSVDADGDGEYDIMMLYMTPVEIKGGDQTVSPVYLSFFANIEGEWVQKGELYTGSASACRYSTAKDQSDYANRLSWLANNSFDPDTWVSVTGVSRNVLLEALKTELGYNDTGV